MYRINHADIKKWAAEYKGELFDAVLCDPPYEISFMQKSWDGSGIAHDVEMWADIYKLLKPGGHLLAFSGTRTYHRVACAIEDAGFEVRDMIEWVYGSGFPKSLNIGKAVDKLQGNEREEFERTDGAGNKQDYLASDRTKSEAGVFGGDKKIFKDSRGTSEWEGWGTALKPAHEPICMARKPLDGTVANNVLKHGTGGLNIDGTRVETPKGDKFGGGGLNSPVNGFMGNTENTYQKGTGFRDDTALGRFPANLILSTPEDEYTLKSNLTPEQREQAKRWLYENA